MYAGIQAVRKDKYSSCQDGQVFRLRMDIDNQEIKEYTIRKAKALWEIPEVPFFCLGRQLMYVVQDCVQR